MGAKIETGIAKSRLRPVKAVSKDADLVRQRRHALVTAAVRVFKAKGFHETTVRDIGRAAAMTQGTIYNYVESKEDILYLVCDQIVSQYQDAIRKALDDSTDPLTRVRLSVKAVCEVMHEHQEGILLVYQNSHLLDTRSRRAISARAEDFIRMFESILSDASRESGRPLRSPHLAANMLTYLPTMIALQRWSLTKRVAYDELIDGITHFIVHGLGFEPRG